MSEEVTNKFRINWQIIIEMGLVFAAIFGTTVPLYLHTDGKMQEAINQMREDRESFHREMKELNKEINTEMKDFHAKLISLEERNKR